MQVFCSYEITMPVFEVNFLRKGLVYWFEI
jgi:hypothetical protein